ncbi:hypothetical protein L3Q82_008192 [Scortum barcoo]|uniref:Uncharacterized protein n=1 Tax=Scortum barcoo TaxID=214431 RepID=A0ACB8WGR3_9TELE|nr:hypothetical protein L3Q82_008192 [Scortum barcoo]
MRQVVLTVAKNKPIFEPDFREEKYPTTKPDFDSGTFTVKNLQPGDKGLYFCATDSDSGLSLHLAQSTIMIPAAPIRLSAALLCVVGLIDASFVTQTPRLWGAESQSVTMNCSHTKDITHIQMYWYRQLPGEGMKQIVLTTPTPPHSYESGFGEDKFPAEKTDPLTGSLTVKKLLPQDSGVYFCAVSQHSDTGSSLSDQVQQTPADMYKKQAEKAEINCKHSNEDFDRILWWQYSSSLSDQVHQTPADMYKKQAEKAEINCKHSNEDFDRILWYKKTHRQLQFLGYMVVPLSVTKSIKLQLTFTMKPGGKAEISCSHSIDSYNRILLDHYDDSGPHHIYNLISVISSLLPGCDPGP